ncbi:MAG: argininosuccinate lyase [Clostridiales bacterium]|uniref:argininosuccinate lyase n=1 Tax=Clostridium sp. N3C TaxID=1776758 RepID=UPI00092DF9D4|nr:argininosuccinate lyase [Clostridium sp. N3C]NLZ47443.1 argininosuccinate lyase [Clostridiales bacterium]SCN26090.1 Argininosuccinate lyase 1 [Clostridium sp. N3C]
MKLWGGRFRDGESSLMEDFNSSLSFDKRLWREDIQGSLAHAKMLEKCGIISKEDADKIIKGLNDIYKDIEEGKLLIEGDYEDIHSFIELNLTERIGDAGKKLHTARSRNDQVAVDMKLYSRKIAQEIIELLDKLIEALKKKGNENNVIMPGYTHLQRAQVITFKYHLAAYVEMFKRDKKRIENAIELLNESPLGCGALAGSTYDIDREFTAKELDFKKPVDNFLDGVSDRDYLIELLSDFSLIMMHLSRLSEELILWSSKEFDFIQMSDLYSTGSSIMPQKKNPDAAELIRGKTGRVYGDLMAILTVLKGIPLAYNKDMQEDKESFFDAVDTVKAALAIATDVILTLEVKKDKMEKAVDAGFLNATEVADYLVCKGVPFRDAHSIVGKIVIYCEDNNKEILSLTLDEFSKFTDKIDASIYDYIQYKNILSKGIKKEIGL